MSWKSNWMVYGYITASYIAGTFLCLAPWSALWHHNYFFEALGLARSPLAGWIRGAISGLGAINLLFALQSIWSAPRREFRS